MINWQLFLCADTLKNATQILVKSQSNQNLFEKKGRHRTKILSHIYSNMCGYLMMGNTISIHIKSGLHQHTFGWLDNIYRYFSYHHHYEQQQQQQNDEEYQKICWASAELTKNIL